MAWHDRCPPIAFLGAGGHASDLLTIVEAWSSLLSIHLKIFLADDTWAGGVKRFEGRVPFVQSHSIEDAVRAAAFVVSVGYPQPRQLVAERALALGGEPASALIHPRAEIGAGSSVGPGSAVMGCTWVSPHVAIGDHAYVGYGSTVGHDTVIGDFTSVMPGSAIGGEVVVGNGVLLGANCAILQGLRIGDDATVGAGAVVARDVAAGETVAGVPAHALPSGERK